MNKVIIFALYWGCKYTYKNEWGTYSAEVGDYHWMDHVKQGAQIHLKELSEITDEDALHIALTFYTHYKSDIINATKESLLVHTESLEYPVADYLRSKGYALPFEGQDLFESGIAIKAK